MSQKVKPILKSILWSALIGQTGFVYAANNDKVSMFNFVNLLFFLLLIFIFLLVLKVRKNAKELDALRNDLRYLSRTDDLTQLYNRRYFEKRLYEIFEMHIRNKSSNSVLMMVGLDDFRSLVNDKGQSAGDLVVQTTARLIQERVRNTDLCGRFSEDTFLVLLHDATVEPAKKLAEKLCLKLKATEVLYGEKKFHTTCSIGLAAYHEGMVSCRDWIQHADQALNKAKLLGGERTMVY